MSKFKASYIILPILSVAIAAGIVLGAKAKAESKGTARVVSASDANESSVLAFGYDDAEDGYYGILKKGSVQSITLNPEMKIQDVLVKKGDTVKKGDKIFTYDLNSLKIELAESENDVKTTENEIKIAENELEVLKKLQPSENAPQTVIPNEQNEDEPPEETFDIPTPEPLPKFEYEKKITVKSKPLSGNGSYEDPFVFNVGEDTIVTKEYLKTLAKDEKNSKFAVFNVCDPTGRTMFSRLVDGSKIDLEKVSDWNVSDGVTINPLGGYSFNGGSASFAEFMINSADVSSEIPEDMPQGDMELPEDFEDIPTEQFEQEQPGQLNQNTFNPDDEITLATHNYVFSKNELKTMIEQKESDIETLKRKKEQAALNVRKANKALESGAETANIDGSVTFLAQDKNHLSETGAYVIITSNSGMSVSSSVGEFSLSDISIGQKMTVTNHSDGSVCMGEVTSISDIPIKSDTMTAESMTESSYEFVVTVDEALKLDDENSGVQIRPAVEESDSNSLIFYTIFVRSEGGKYYMLVANQDNVLEKRYVKVGRKIFGYYIEVLDGISKDDKIAVAYGKNQEGMPVTDGDYETIVYGAGILGG